MGDHGQETVANVLACPGRRLSLLHGALRVFLREFAAWRWVVSVRSAGSAKGAVAFVRGIAPDAENRERDDFYPTPPEATRALLDAEIFAGSIWEPACGDGAISKVLVERGHQVYSSDLIDRGYGDVGRDFLLDYQTTAANIITNPPFKFAEEFACHALARATRKIALLARLGWLEGIERRNMFMSTPLARVLVFSNRIPMNRNGEAKWSGGAGMIAFAWYVWDHAHRGPPTLGFLLSDKAGRGVRSLAAEDPADARTADLFEEPIG